MNPQTALCLNGTKCANLWNLTKCEENSSRFRAMSQKSSLQFTSTISASLITGLLKLECKKRILASSVQVWAGFCAVLTLWMKMTGGCSSCCQQNISCIKPISVDCFEIPPPPSSYLTGSYLHYVQDYLPPIMFSDPLYKRLQSVERLTNVNIQKMGIKTEIWSSKSFVYRDLLCVLFASCPCSGAGETPYLPRGLDALDDGHADQDPGYQQGQGHLPVQPTGVVDGAGDVESLTVPEVGGGWALLTFRHHDWDGDFVKENRKQIWSVTAATLKPAKWNIKKHPMTGAVRDPASNRDLKKVHF